MADQTMTDMQHLTTIVDLKRQLPLEIEPGTAALFVVDLQRWFTEPQHPLGQVLERLGMASGYLERVNERVLPNTLRLLGAFRSRGVPVYFTAVGTEAGDGSDLPSFFKGFDALGLNMTGQPVFPSPQDESWAIDSRLAPRPDERLLSKHTASPFADRDLAAELRERGVRWVIVAGVVTECCVGQTARDAAERGFDVILVDDAATGVSDSAHEVLVEAFAAVFGHRRSTAEILELLAGRSAAAEAAQTAEV
jgi:biuret amidohydrolase